MDVDSGRVYQPDEFEKRQRALDLGVKLDEHQAEFQRRYGEGKIVPVSDEVAMAALRRALRSYASSLARRCPKAARKRNRRS